MNDRATKGMSMEDGEMQKVGNENKLSEKRSRKKIEERLLLVDLAGRTHVSYFQSRRARMRYSVQENLQTQDASLDPVEHNQGSSSSH